MNHATLKNFLKFALDQRIQGNAIAPIVWSSTGVGKTSTIKEFANDIGAELTVLHLASQEPGDLIGLPARDEKNSTTKWLRPEWFPLEDSEKVHVIFLDEFNRCHKSVMDVMLPFLLEGEIHTHRVPQNTLIVAAANPDDGENYNVTSIDDAAMLSRLCHVKLNSDFTSWKNFCNGEVHEALVTVAKRSGKFGSGFNMPTVEPDPRSLYMSGKALNEMSEDQYNEFGLEFLIGMIGDMANAVNEEIRLQAKGSKKFNVTPEDIVNNYSKVKSKILKASKNSVAAISELSSSLNESVCNGIHLNSLGEADTDKMENIYSFLLDVPREVFASFIMQSVKICESNNNSNEGKTMIKFLHIVSENNEEIVEMVSSLS